VIKLKINYQFSEKKCANIAASLYTQITKTTQEKALQKNRVLAFIKTYEAALKN